MTDKKPKIAILHDAFLYRWGGERLVTLMAKALDADLVSGFFSDGSFDPRELGFTGKMIPLGSPVFAKGLRHAVLKYRFINKTQFLSEYDIVIFSGNCLDAVWNIGKNTKKIYYCHTPPRYIFDFRERYIAKFPKWLHSLADKILDHQAHVYTTQLQQMDHIFTNSENVHTRLMSFCGVESEVLYPPTDVNHFSPGNKQISKPYFLSFARLSPPKRVDLIVDAFLQMPDQNLVFTYGKNDPMKSEILAKIAWKSNIKAIESPNDDELIRLIQGATATIYIPIDEDFGMSPVESMACGTPVIGVDEWGLRETIVHNKTGKLIWGIHSGLPLDKGGRGDLVSELKNIIQHTKKEEWVSMRDACILRTQDFSLDAFEKKLKSSLFI